MNCQPVASPGAYVFCAFLEPGTAQQALSWPDSMKSTVQGQKAFLWVLWDLVLQNIVPEHYSL